MVADQLHNLYHNLYSTAFRAAMQLAERDLVPDVLLRMAIRYLLSCRLSEERKGGQEVQQAKIQAFVDELRSLPIAIQQTAANKQHYEVPTSYFLLCLGKHLKYSCCLYPGLDAATPLDDAEEAMLSLCCERAELADGQDVLELGCGWGSLCLFVAARYPRSRVTAVSNSRTQRELIEARATQWGLSNLEVITADVVTFETVKRFDRVVSVEMFEHMKNYEALLAKIAAWLKPQGLLFVHMFTHKLYAYHFEGTLTLAKQWYVNGRHYSITLEAWLARMDMHRAEIMPIMKETYGKQDGVKWWVYWRLFYLACSELFNYGGGEEWGVSHYLFRKA